LALRSTRSTIIIETVTRTKCNIIDVEGTEFKIELFRLSEDPHDLDDFDADSPLSSSETDTFVASAEDVIVTKLRWARD